MERLLYVGRRRGCWEEKSVGSANTSVTFPGQYTVVTAAYQLLLNRARNSPLHVIMEFSLPTMTYLPIERNFSRR